MFLEVEPCVIETRYPLSLSIPIDEEDINRVNEDIQCIHYPTADGTLMPASTNNMDASLSSLSSSSSVPLLPTIADSNDDNDVNKEGSEVVTEPLLWRHGIHYLSLSLSLRHRP